MILGLNWNDKNQNSLKYYSKVSSKFDPTGNWTLKPKSNRLREDFSTENSEEDSSATSSEVTGSEIEDDSYVRWTFWLDDDDDDDDAPIVKSM